MKAVRKHTQEKWVILYIERWLKAEIQHEDGGCSNRGKGTPQGGVISPVLSNLFLHYVFDIWMKRNHPRLPWCRYADDGLVHCNTEAEAIMLETALNARFAECGLTLHPQKTKIVYCKDGKRTKRYKQESFDFLGYTFRARKCWNSKAGKTFTNFTPAVSNSSLKAMRKKIKERRWQKRTEMSLSDIANKLNPVIRGWINYYGRYTRSALYQLARYINKTLVVWQMKKHKKLNGRRTKSARVLKEISKRQPRMFVHWEMGIRGAFA